jgi:hypothetical protein
MLIFLIPFLLLFGCIHGSFDPSTPIVSPASVHFEKRVTNSSSTGPSFANSTQSDLERARAIVNEARKEWGVYKKARLQNPRRNVYTLRPEEPIQPKVLATDNSSSIDPFPPKITDEISKAAALLAEWNVAQGSMKMNITSRRLKKRANPFWMQDVDHLGTIPYGANSSYQVPLCHEQSIRPDSSV